MGVLRYLLYILVTLAFVVIAPVDLAAKLNFAFTAIIFLFAFTIGFLIDRTMERKRVLRENLNIELSRLRRIHHIGEYLGTAKWRASLDDALTRYQLSVSQDITNYPEANNAYREVSHKVYGYKAKNRQEEILLEDLLDTTRELALGRQKIQRGLDGWIEPYHWMIISINSYLLIFVLIFAKEGEIFARLSIGASVLAVLLSLDLLRHSNKFTTADMARFQQKYQVNIPEKQDSKLK